MSRPKLGPTENVWLQVRIPVELRDEFDAACNERGRTMSVQTRALLTKWLRQLASVQRAKGKKC